MPLPPEYQFASASKIKFSLPEVAVVILNWNGLSYLQEFLPPLLNSEYPNLKVVVADNGSTDTSVTWLFKNYPDVMVLQNSVNEGFAGGYNRALGFVNADYYVLLNSDVLVSPDWIMPVIDLMESDKLIAACQPKIKSYHEPEKFEYAGASGGWLDKYGYPFSRGRIFDILEEDEGQYNDPAPCFWASGAAMFVRAHVFWEMKGFDQYFFAHQEEIDLCWRMQLAGYKVYVQPESVVYHIGGGTLPKANNQKVFLNFRNNLIMLAKNYKLLDRFTKLPVRMALDAVAAWKGLFTGSRGYFIAIVRAHLHFFNWLIFHRSQSPKVVRKNKVFTGWYNGSAVWRHFVKKQTKFSEIVSSK
jgi:GT2 family glycosyltransferase